MKRLLLVLAVAVIFCLTSTGASSQGIRFVEVQIAEPPIYFGPIRGSGRLRWRNTNPSQLPACLFISISHIDPDDGSRTAVGVRIGQIPGGGFQQFVEEGQDGKVICVRAFWTVLVPVFDLFPGITIPILTAISFEDDATEYTNLEGRTIQIGNDPDVFPAKQFSRRSGESGGLVWSGTVTRCGESGEFLTREVNGTSLELAQTDSVLCQISDGWEMIAAHREADDSISGSTAIVYQEDPDNTGAVTIVATESDASGAPVYVLTMTESRSGNTVTRTLNVDSDGDGNIDSIETQTQTGASGNGTTTTVIERDFGANNSIDETETIHLTVTADASSQQVREIRAADDTLLERFIDDVTAVGGGYLAVHSWDRDGDGTLDVIETHSSETGEFGQGFGSDITTLDRGADGSVDATNVFTSSRSLLQGQYQERYEADLGANGSIDYSEEHQWLLCPTDCSGDTDGDGICDPVIETPPTKGKLQ